MNGLWRHKPRIKFTFNNIMLPDSNSDEAKSHGQIRFSIKLKSGLALGTQLTNKAQIYFDTNPAIVTNTTLNTLANPNGIQTISTTLGASVYPNPVKNELNIELESTQPENSMARIYSINSKMVKQIQINSKHTQINIQELPSGIYILKLHHGNQFDILKFVKE